MKKHPRKGSLTVEDRTDDMGRTLRGRMSLREAGQQWWGKLRKHRVILDTSVRIFKRGAHLNYWAAPPKRQPCPKCSSWVKRTMWWTGVAQYYCSSCHLHFEVATNITYHAPWPAGGPITDLSKEEVLAIRRRPSRFRRAFDWLRQAINFKSKIKPVRV